MEWQNAQLCCDGAWRYPLRSTFFCAVTCTDRLRSLNLLAFPIPTACRNAAMPQLGGVLTPQLVVRFLEPVSPLNSAVLIHIFFFFFCFLFVFMLCSLAFYDFLILCWWASLLAYLIKAFWVFLFIICFALFSWVPYWNLLSCRLIITISCVVCYKSEEFWHCTSRFLAAFAQLVGRKKGRRSELKSKRWRPVKFLMEYVTDSPFDALLFLFSYKLHI